MTTPGADGLIAGLETLLPLAGAMTTKSAVILPPLLMGVATSRRAMTTL